ncbi:MAG: hypothetical protein P3W90_006035 [Paracoccus sp. (in: a-proteobacteria)]|nr:hypothetical protein [Paracoccus sp. (in: a-proteobacteria)]
MLEGLLTLIVGGLALAALGFSLWLTLWLFVWLPAGMAKERNRSATNWVLISLFMSPVLAAFLLMALGPAPDDPPD